MRTRRRYACTECTRPVTLRVNRQPRMCVECHNRLITLETLETITDLAERAALVAYAQQMRDDAADKGGVFEGEMVRNPKPEPEPAYMPPEIKPKVGRPRKPPKEKLPHGRPPRVGGRMVMVGMRVPPETQAKLHMLGRDWLILAVANAIHAKETP
jgi:hypothetical protein